MFTLCGLVDVMQSAAVEINDPVGSWKKTFVMGCDDTGHACRLEKGDGIEHFFCIGAIKIGCRFVCQNDLRLVDDGTCDGDPLLFAFRQRQR